MALLLDSTKIQQNHKYIEQNEVNYKLTRGRQMEPKLMAQARFTKSLQERKLFLSTRPLLVRTQILSWTRYAAIHEFITLS